MLRYKSIFITGEIRILNFLFECNIFDQLAPREVEMGAQFIRNIFMPAQKKNSATTKEAPTRAHTEQTTKTHTAPVLCRRAPQT